ncbi:iron-sulfur cluster assembly scaffold protein [Desulfatirhabdium butyrativorans]|uniref:iron-sulfur cluster assembly scaffold protein n=1 Tax=Desulfatirhabdium butyrativorans TaxID=340467 RepID=UPI001FDF01B6|nr:iron-sulfur cluster assembly scaffold protein [Desulfatirhabdium butyrativorans]
MDSTMTSETQPEASKTDFWQSHSMKFLEMAFRTDKMESMVHPDGFGTKTGDCGDTVEIYLKLQDERIAAASYGLRGCLNTAACANAIIEMIEGKSIDEAWEITPETVAEYLETLPADHFHCAELAVGALYLALSDSREKQQSPWKKLYGTK